MMYFVEKVRTLFKTNKHLRIGAPLICFIVVGPFVLQNFAQIKLVKIQFLTCNRANYCLRSFRFKYFVDRTKVSQEELRELDRIKAKPEVTLEEAFEEVKNMDIDNWEQIRGPRPWEEPETVQQKKQK